MKIDKMKAFIAIAYLLSVLIVTGCNNKLSGTVKTVYMERSGDRKFNWLKIETKRKITRCIFYGHDKLSNSVPIYYWAEAEKLTMENDSIYFWLTYYTVSYRPYGQPLLPFEQTDSVQAPIDILAPQVIKGTISKDTMKLIRYSMVGNSNFDRITLVKN